MVFPETEILRTISLYEKILFKRLYKQKDSEIMFSICVCKNLEHLNKNCGYICRCVLLVTRHPPFVFYTISSVEHYPVILWKGIASHNFLNGNVGEFIKIYFEMVTMDHFK